MTWLMRSSRATTFPPDTTPFTAAALLSILLLASAARLSAQSVRGRVLDDSTGTPVSNVRISALGAGDELLAMATSDGRGHFAFRLEPRSNFRLTASRIGYAPNASEVVQADSLEALDIELRITTRPLSLPTVSVVSRKLARTEGDRRLERAQSLGGRMVSPESIREAAPTSRTLGDLMRRTAGHLVQVVSGYGGATCLLVQRTANLRQQQTCALLVVDDVVSAGDAYIAPTDIELVVVIPASAASVRFGERARFGAVAVYTRAGMPAVKRPPADDSASK
jgi:hypothetical protein